MKIIKYEYKTFRFYSSTCTDADKEINKYINAGWILESFQTCATHSSVSLLYLLKREI